MSRQYAQAYEKQDITGKFFTVFHGLAQVTAGVSLSSQNALASLEKDVEVTEKYYLLYYRPQDYRPGSRFRAIEVKVKNKNYKILHRGGYLAD